MSDTNFSTTAPPPGNPDAGAYMNEGEPDIAVMQEEYQYAWNQDPDASTRIARAEDIRYSRWPGQSDDGLKHQELMPEGKRALPYDRAPDTRVPLVDSLILDLVDLEYAAFWNARVKTAPVTASRLTVAQAAEWRQVISWMIHGPLRASLIDNVEFASQVMNTIGWVVLHPHWRQKVQMRLARLTLQQIIQLSAQAPEQSILAQAPVLIADPTSEEAAVGLLQQLFPNLKKPRARRVIQELRAGEEAEFPVPDQVENVPELEVLVPWQDFILPIESTARPDRARRMWRRVFLNTSDLEARAREEDWSQDFVEAVLKTKGQAMENGTSVEHVLDANQQLIEIAYDYARQVDEDGVQGIYCTAFSPHVQAAVKDKQLYGAHWLLDDSHGEYPFIFLQTEVTGRRPADARGVPHVLPTSQTEMKQQRDATYVYSQLSVTPPLQKRGSQASKLPPELGPLGIINITNGSEWSWFPPPPGRPDIAFKLIEDIRKESEDYHGIPRIDTPPMRWQPRQQRRGMRFLSKWGEAFWQLSALAYQNLEPGELAAILGHPPLLTTQMVCRHRLLFWFDVRALDPEWVEALLQAITQMVLPMDAAGVVDRAKLVQFALAYLDPTLAEEVTTDQEGAKQALFKGVRDEIGSIMQGNEAMYTENDPTARAKLLFAQQILQANPDYVVQLQENSAHFNPRKRELLDKYLKNLGQSVVQQQNKVVGRLGVNPGVGQG